jgi:nucleoside-diphosphate-sugar epimerase
MKIAVTGGNGRVGRAVIESAAAAGHTVVSIDRRHDPPATRAADFYELDATEYDALERAITGCDALIHLAAISGPGRSPDDVVHSNNVVSSYNALRAAAAAGVRRVCQASSVNAIGGRFSRWPPRYDYFPVDEQHPTYAEDSYSLSKWICEQQADAIARQFRALTIASLRLHGVVTDRTEMAPWIDSPDKIAERHLWGYTLRDAATRAFMLGVTADFAGHEAFYIVAPETMVDTPSLELKERYYPTVPVQGDLGGTQGFFDCRKAGEILGWRHDAD